MKKKDLMTTQYTLRFKLQRSLGARGQSLWPTRVLTDKQKFVLANIPKKKLSGYGHNVLFRRTLSALYGKISTTQIKRFWTQASRLPGKTGENFLSGLESRLETVVYRLNFCRSFREARQYIVHGFISVNGRPVTIPNARLHPGDLVSVTPKHFDFLARRLQTAWQEKACVRTKSLHLEVDFQTLSAIFLFSPQHILYPLEFELRSLI